MVIIQETKMSSISDIDLNEIWGNIRFDWKSVNAERKNGGILISWQSEFFNMSKSKQGQNWLSISSVIISVKFQYSIFAIYIPSSPA